MVYAESCSSPSKRPLKWPKTAWWNPKHLRNSDLSHLLPSILTEIGLDKPELAKDLETLYQKAWGSVPWAKWNHK